MAGKEEVLGFKKIVYREGNEIKTVKGDVVFNDEFFIVNDSMWINKKDVIAVKDAGSDETTMGGRK